MIQANLKIVILGFPDKDNSDGTELGKSSSLAYLQE